MADDAWTQELSTLRGVIAPSYRREDEPDGGPQTKRDVEQMVKGILLIATLPDPAFDAAWKHLAMDIQRRRPAWAFIMGTEAIAGAFAALIEEMSAGALKYGDQLSLPIRAHEQLQIRWRLVARTVESMARAELGDAESTTPTSNWQAVLATEWAEAVQAPPSELRGELMQVAAIAMRTVLAIDHQGFPDQDEAPQAALVEPNPLFVDEGPAHRRKRPVGIDELEKILMTKGSDGVQIHPTGVIEVESEGPGEIHPALTRLMAAAGAVTEAGSSDMSEDDIHELMGALEEVRGVVKATEQ